MLCSLSAVSGFLAVLCFIWFVVLVLVGFAVLGFFCMNVMVLSWMDYHYCSSFVYGLVVVAGLFY